MKHTLIPIRFAVIKNKFDAYYSKMLVTVALVLTILISSTSSSYASIGLPETCLKSNKFKLESIVSSKLPNDAYLMVMQQQVEKGDLSITMSFYMDQMTNLYKMSQLSADMQINHGFYLNNFTQIEPALLTSADQLITKDFMEQNAE